MTHPFLHRGLPISCSQQGIYCRISKHTLKHTYEIPLLLQTLPWFVPYIFHIPSSLHSFFSLSLPGRKPHRMKSVRGAGMIGQWEAGCHQNSTHIQCTRTPTEKELEGEGAMEKWGVLVTGTSCFHIRSSHPIHRGVWKTQQPFLLIMIISDGKPSL